MRGKDGKWLTFVDVLGHDHIAAEPQDVFDHDVPDHVHELLIDAVRKHGGQEMPLPHEFLPGTFRKQQMQEVRFVFCA